MATGTDAAEQANRSGMDPKRLVVIFYLVSAVVLALFLDRMLGALFARLAIPNPEAIAGVEWTITTLLGVVISAATAVGCYLHPRTRQLSLETASELMKVTWPSVTETRVATVAVIVASLIAAAVLFGIDTLAYKLMVDWLPKAWGIING